MSSPSNGPQWDSLRKWAVFIALVALIIWQGIMGLTVGEIGVWGFTLKFNSSDKKAEATASPTTTPPTTSRSAIKVQGTVGLGRYVDLDDGTLPESLNPNLGADLQLEGSDSSNHVLSPVNGARMTRVQGASPSRDECSNSSRTGASVLVRDVVEGSYLCLRTDQGRYSAVQVVSDNAGEGITIRFVTWEAK
jgi:hypothetical protein